MPANLSPADEVLSIAKASFSDAARIHQLIEILEAQNRDGVNRSLSAAGAGRAADVAKNAFVADLVLLVERAYSRPRAGDGHIGRAFQLLQTPEILENCERICDAALLRGCIDMWAALNTAENHRKVKHFRDKFTAHIGLPDPDIPLPTFGKLFSFAKETASLLSKFAITTRQSSASIEAFDGKSRLSAEAFWKPWRVTPAGDPRA